MGKCPSCGEWNTYDEVTEQAETHAAKKPKGIPEGFRSVPQRLSDVSTEQGARFSVPVEEFSRVLGGGIVPGSIILVGGEPGIGKSTLLLQLSGMLAMSVGRVLYVSGEESSRQIKM